jgi:hypothetical protein
MEALPRNVGSSPFDRSEEPSCRFLSSVRKSTVLVAVFLLATTPAVAVSAPAQAIGPLISQEKPTIASSVKGGAQPPNSTDGTSGTRGRTPSVTAVEQVDLGATRAVDQVTRSKEGA